ncbi:hypothetical protein [Spirochaeta thermophila]|uniref:Uncharacterized protein n=1 Tax=Winmispira thermophila (strain ATCC 49972 / DSM 6192 / RI 19.B1) TaxID=665571 RepID=E0RTY5_WINT6|nr:hypothetical protein [Spirochaeta thermophila]ADN01041.1 hypothetical protein STHERM_c00650 [Spirochaeta thermophila DSM 6192]
MGLWLSPDLEGVRLVSPMEDGAPRSGYSLAEATMWYGYCSYTPLTVRGSGWEG